MSRSRYKFNHVSNYFWRWSISRIRLNRWQHFKDLKIFSKSNIILPCFRGKLVEIHKGSGFKKVILNQRMVGYKFGLFIITRKPFFFPIKVKKKKK